MSRKKVIIIGAGIAGLSAGCYLQMNGYETEIFELHGSPGGLCTGWRRQGYTFDGCIHWLCGSSPKNELHTIWEELHAIDEKNIVNHEIFIHTKLEKGKSFSVYTNVDKLQEEMLKNAPEDKELIEEFIDAINLCKKFDMPVLKPQNLFSLFHNMKFLFKDFPLVKLLNKWMKVSIGEFQKKFKSPLLNKNFCNLFGMYEEMPILALVYTLALFDINSAGYPIGGSIEFIKSIKNRYLSLGGKTNYNSKVEKILVSNNSAKGVRLNSGKEAYSDLVISAADGHYTLYNMLDGKFIDEDIEGYYKSFKTFPSLLQVSLGVDRLFKGIPDAVTYNFNFSAPIYIDNKNTISSLGLVIYNFDPTMAPKGKTSITTFIEADYNYWTELRNSDLEKYKAEKERIAEEVIDRIDKLFGEVKSKVEVYDVATPYTYENYTNNWKGSFEGWIPTIDNLDKTLKKTLPGLKDFYMIGQWVQPGGGLPTGGMHGRHIAQQICKEDRRRFKTLR